MAAILSPNLIYKAWDNNGNPLAGGKLYTYAAGTTTPQVSYVDSTQTTQNTNPIILNFRGECSLWLDPTLSYKFVQQDSSGASISTTDNVSTALSSSTLGNLIPSLNNTYTLGSAALTWANLYLGPTNTAVYDSVTGDVGYYGAIAAESGYTITNHAYPPMCVDRYAVNGSGVDMSGAFTTAVKVAQKAGGIVTYGATGTYLLLHAVDCTFATTANQYGVIIQGNGGIDAGTFPIVAKHNESAIFDCTGNDSIEFRGVCATTDNTTYPQTGILTARNSHGGSIVFRASNCKFIGKFSYAPYYNYGSEDDVLVACYWWNTLALANTKTRIYTANNIFSLTSSFVTIATGAQSCTDHNDFGCLDQNTGGFTNSDCIYLEQVDSFKKFGGWAYSGGSSNGGSLIKVDQTNAASNYCSIKGMTGEYVSTAITSLSTLVGGSGYSTPGTYNGVALTGGNGSGATANITVAGGAVTVVALQSGGDRYLVGDVLSAAAANIGGGGSNFSITVATVAGTRQTWGLLFGAGAFTCIGWDIDSCKLPNMNYAIATNNSNTTLNNFALRNLNEQSGGGINIAGTLSQSPSFQYGETVTVIGTSTNNNLVGDTSRLTVTTRTNDYWTDTGTPNKTFAPGIANGVNGWTTVGGITQSGKYLLSGNTASFEIQVSAATSVACTNTATITTLPVAASTAGVAFVVDTVAGTIIPASISSQTITITTAITATAHVITIYGTYFVA